MTSHQPSTSNSLGDRPEWWPREETWQEFVGTLDNIKQRTLIIAEAEYAFGLKIADYPHVVTVGSRETLNDFCDFIDLTSSWLVDRKIDCVAYDTNAVGKYKELSNAVLFKNADDAMLFKLTWK